jgi:hypothetical protein
MRTFMHIGSVVIAAAFALALTIDAADARRGGGGGMRGGGFSGGGMRAGGGAGRFAGAGPRRPHVSQPIARPGIGNRPGGGPVVGNRPGWDNRPGWGYRPGYGAGYAVGAAALGAGLASSAYYGGYDSGYYGYADDQAYAASSDPIAECARRFKTYDPASQTYIKRKGERASCP